MNKSIAVIWRNTGVMCIGFVLMQNDFNQVTCRVGTAIGMDDTKEDIEFIMRNGSKMKREEAIALFPHHEATIKKHWKE